MRFFRFNSLRWLKYSQPASVVKSRANCSFSFRIRFKVSEKSKPDSLSDSLNVQILILTGSDKDICRICHCEGDMQLPLISPCFCAGSLKYVHQACLQQWIKSSDTKCCELCKFEFIMNTKVKPFTKVGMFLFLYCV